MLSSIVTFRHASWGPPTAPDIAASAARSLERGDVLFLPDLAFPIESDERQIFSPAVLSSSKNASFDPSSGRMRGTTLQGAPLDRLGRMMRRFSDAAAGLVREVLPAYRERLQRARSSFRPAEIAGRASSWRKDDTLLHVDSFTASPVQDRRILRVFTNVNPEGRARTWRIGGDFEDVATRFAARLSLPWPGSAFVLRAVGATRSHRSTYDALMLQLHDRMKEDADYQQSTPQTVFEFPSGSTWMAFTDQVSHAAMAGQYQLEQTFYLPVEAMIDDSRSPLRILERLKSRRLV